MRASHYILGVAICWPAVLQLLHCVLWRLKYTREELPVEPFFLCLILACAWQTVLLLFLACLPSCCLPRSCIRSSDDYHFFTYVRSAAPVEAAQRRRQLRQCAWRYPSRRSSPRWYLAIARTRSALNKRQTCNRSRTASTCKNCVAPPSPPHLPNL